MNGTRLGARTSADASTGSGFLTEAGKQPRKIEVLQVGSGAGVRCSQWGPATPYGSAQRGGLLVIGQVDTHDRVLGKY